jgi:hypothetical protein
MAVGVGVLPGVDGLVIGSADAADEIPKIRTSGINFFMWVAPQYGLMVNLL